MNSHYKKKTDPRDPRYVSAIEKDFPRIVEKIILMWGAPDFTDYLNSLMIDMRGDRAGFPFDVLDEMMFLIQLHDYRIGKPNVVNKTSYRIG